jgi:hypothetical protein
VQLGTATQYKPACRLCSKYGLLTQQLEAQRLCEACTLYPVDVIHSVKKKDKGIPVTGRGGP